MSKETFLKEWNTEYLQPAIRYLEEYRQELNKQYPDEMKPIILPHGDLQGQPYLRYNALLFLATIREELCSTEENIKNCKRHGGCELDMWEVVGSNSYPENIKLKFRVRINDVEEYVAWLLQEMAALMEKHDADLDALHMGKNVWLNPSPHKAVKSIDISFPFWALTGEEE